MELKRKVDEYRIAREKDEEEMRFEEAIQSQAEQELRNQHAQILIAKYRERVSCDNFLYFSQFNLPFVWSDLFLFQFGVYFGKTLMLCISLVCTSSNFFMMLSRAPYYQLCITANVIFVV